MRLGLEAGNATLDLAAALGIQGVPVQAAALVKEGADATLAPLAARGLSVCQIGAFGFNALNVDAEQRRIVEEAIPLATQTGCTTLVIGPGNYQRAAFAVADRRNFSTEALDEMARVLAPLLELAETHGVQLSIEAYLKGAIYSPARFLALWERVRSPALRVNIDPTSLYDFWDLIDPSARVKEVCTRLADHYGVVHIKEVALAEGFHLHAGLVPLGQGPTDWAEFLRLIAPHLPTDGWVLLEHVHSAEEARASVAFLMEKAAQAGVAWTPPPRVAPSPAPGRVT